MSKVLRNPRLFSKQFNVPTSALAKADLLDPFLNSDTKLFIDPLLLKGSANSDIRSKGYPLFRKHVGKITQLLLASKNSTDPAWVAAMRLLNLSERRETCLGYGGAGVSGSSRPDSLKQRILHTTKEVLELGITNPEIISLMGVFEDDVGPDTISDLTTNAILPIIQEITLKFCKKYSVPTKQFTIGFDQYELPINPYAPEYGFALVPKDILRELPVATDWSDIDRVVKHNQMLRHKVSQMVTDIAKATIKQKKRALKTIALNSKNNFQEIFDGFFGNNYTGYDFERDKKSIAALRELLDTVAQQNPRPIAKPIKASGDELRRVVREVVAQFKHLVENGDISRLLWDGSKPKSEKSAQLVFFAIADSYCKANDIDISPEVHSGGGPVDFKFSTGYSGRLLVEMKLSKGNVVHGYETQLEVYKAAASTEEAIYLVVNVGDLKDKVTKIQTIRNEALAQGKRASEIVLVDATRKPSASKR